MRLMLDTNITLDFMLAREPHFAEARKLMLLGYLREVELWVSGAQFNDLLYILTNGGKRAHNEAARQRLKKLRQCIHVLGVGEREADVVLSSNWGDLEDAFLYQAALSIQADCIISRNQQDFVLSTLKVFDAGQFFEYLETQEGLTYTELFM